MTRIAVPLLRSLRYDGDSSTTQYVGEAAIGAGTDVACWRIFRLVYTGGSITLTWADGNDEFDNVWDNRASLSYS